MLGIQPQHTPKTVYNLEVQGQHVFRVTSNGLLVHNSYADEIAKLAGDTAKKIFGKAPRGLPFKPHWTGRTINYKKGAMSPIEHIFYRHGPNSGFSNVGRFASGTRAKNVASMVDEAIKKGKMTFNASGKGGAIVHDFGHQIGTHMDGSIASRIQIYFNEFGEIMTAFPIK